MISSPVRFERARPLGLAVALAMAVGASAACSAVGTVTGGPGSAQATGSGGSGVNGSGSGGSTSATGTGGITAIANNGMVSMNLSWYDTLKSTDCSGTPTALPASRIWRLSATQWQNTVSAALGVSSPSVSSFPPDQLNARTGFDDDSTGDKITLPLAQAYFTASTNVATQAAATIVSSMSCLGQTPVTATCAQAFASTYGAKLFRRALTSTETSTYSGFLTQQLAADPAQPAVASTLQVMMMSPNFEFRTELGNSVPGPVTMTNDEIAQLLSYSIADIPPDAALEGVVSQLGDATVRQAQAERLAGLSSAKAKLNQFWNEYLALGDQPTTPGVDQSAWVEATTFFSNVVWNNNGTLKDLLTAPYTWADKTVAAVYGNAQPDSTGKLSLDPTQRAGFLTSVAMLTQTAAPSQAATVIHRGLLVRERVLCQTPPPPPATVVPDPAQIQQAGPNATARQNYQYFTMVHADCNACHSFFQPLGLAFEAYDANGAFRTQYPAPISMPIDTTGMLNTAGDATGSYQDVVGMAGMLGASQMAGYCMSQQFAEFAFGRSIDLDQEACTVKTMGDYVTGKGGQMSTLLASIAATPTMTRRFHQ